MKTSFWIAALLLSTTPVAAQQAQCNTGEKFADCASRLVDESLAAAIHGVATEKVQDDKKAIAKKATSESAPETANSLRDVLPLFFGALGLGSTSSDTDALTLNFNPDFLDFGPQNAIAVKAIIHNPMVFDAMIKQLPADIQADRKTTLTNRLEDFDDVEYFATWSRQNDHYGRAVQPHLSLVADTFSRINKLALGQLKSARPSHQEVLNLLQSPELANVDLDSTPVDKMPPPARDKVLAVLDGFVKELVTREAKIHELAGTLGFFNLADLVNNQPQVTASVSYRRRNDLVGPDEGSAKVSYEIGMANVNGLRRFCEGQKKEASDPGCLSAYLSKFGKTLTEAPRAALSVQYSVDDKYHFALPDDHFRFDLNRVQKWVASASVGRYLRSNEQGVQTTRVDLQADYENTSGDDKHQPSRLVATATFTHKMSDDTSATFSIIYANRPEFLGEVDKGLSARVGLKYKIDKKKDSPAS